MGSEEDQNYEWEDTFGPDYEDDSDEQILEAMRPAICQADGGYVFDTAKDDVIAAGRALLAKELNP